MAEEQQRCQEGYRLCANNCGFFGNPATMNLCSQCFSANISVHASPAPSPSTAVHVSSVFASSSSVEVLQTATEAVSLPPPRKPGRCTACSKKVGILGFQCRCGASYCGVHRYPEQHGCGFDFKKAGREAIARANPVVKADKLNGRI